MLKETVILRHVHFYNYILYTLLVCMQYLYITSYIMSFLLSKSRTLPAFNIAKCHTEVSVNSVYNWELNWLRIKAATTMCYKPQSIVSSVILIYYFLLAPLQQNFSSFVNFTFLIFSSIWDFLSWIIPITKYSRSPFNIIVNRFCNFMLNDA